MLHVAYHQHAQHATQHQLGLFEKWELVLNNLNSQTDLEIGSKTVANDEAVFDIGDINDTTGLPAHDPSVSQYIKPTISSTELASNLNERQQMVHDIVANSLHLHLTGQAPPQKLMVVRGEGGTGKSALLNSISATFQNMGVPHLLAKTAMSGVAASVVGGQTLHSWAALPVQTPRSDKWVTHPSKEVDARRKKNIENAVWLTIDGMSMLTTPLLALLHQVTGTVHSHFETIAEGLPFGGLNVILLGDFNQLPPVASSKKELYNSTPPNHLAHLGRNLFEQFDIVITLEQQMHITDPKWCAILKQAWTGDCTANDITAIHKLVLENPQCDIPDFLSSPWNEAILVTPRNSSQMC